LIAGLWLGGTAVIAVAAAPPLFEQLKWTAPGAEYEALSSQPAACLNFGGEDAALAPAGQALFNAPTLLGGQAAKAGLSCASCHVNGRDNKNFLMAGVSDKAGTADVTNSFFSAARGNGRFDPVQIPDLAVPGKVSPDPKAKQLTPFIRTLIVDEFSGHEPTPAMLDALSAYVRAVGDCQQPSQPRSLQDQLLIVQGAVDGAFLMAQRNDPQAMRALIAAARHQLGLIAERYAGPGLKRERALLLSASRELQAVGDFAKDPAAFAKELSDWLTRFDDALLTTLERSNAKSLYNPKRLPMKPKG
jgi:hypothetical protein